MVPVGGEGGETPALQVGGGNLHGPHHRETNNTRNPRKKAPRSRAKQIRKKNDLQGSPYLGKR